MSSITTKKLNLSNDSTNNYTNQGLATTTTTTTTTITTTSTATASCQKMKYQDQMLSYRDSYLQQTKGYSSLLSKEDKAKRERLLS